MQRHNKTHNSRSDAAFSISCFRLSMPLQQRIFQDGERHSRGICIFSVLWSHLSLVAQTVKRSPTLLFCSRSANQWNLRAPDSEGARTFRGKQCRLSCLKYVGFVPRSNGCRSKWDLRILGRRAIYIFLHAGPSFWSCVWLSQRFSQGVILLIRSVA